MLDLWGSQRLAGVGVLKGTCWKDRRYWSASEMHEIQPIFGASFGTDKVQPVAMGAIS